MTTTTPSIHPVLALRAPIDHPALRGRTGRAFVSGYEAGLREARHQVRTDPTADLTTLTVPDGEPTGPLPEKAKSAWRAGYTAALAAACAAQETRP